MDAIYRQWAENIRTWREANRMTQAQLAEACDVRQSVVSKWESAQAVPSDLHKVRIARALLPPGRDPRILFPLTGGAS